jgi:hypothetical protein
MPDPIQQSSESASDFAKAAEGRHTGIIGEFLSFLKHNKKWWLGPIVLVLVLLGVLLILWGTGAAPFIYTLF